MRLVKVFESGGDAVLGLPYGFCFGQVALCLLRYQFRHIAHSEKLGPILNLHRPSESFLVFSALHHVSFLAVPATKPAVEEVLALLAGNLEADVAEAFSWDNRLLTYAADDDCLEFHRSPPKPGLLFLVGQL